MKGLDRVAADRRHLLAMQARCSTGFTWMRALARAVPAALVAVPAPAKAVPGPLDRWRKAPTQYGR